MLAQSSSILSIDVAPIMCEMAISRPGGLVGLVEFPYNV